MTVTAANDTVTYKSPRGDTERPADMVVAVNADGTAIGTAPGTAATNLGKAEDAAHTSGDVGVMLLGVRNDADAARSGTDGDYTPLAVDSAGRLKPKPYSFLSIAAGQATTVVKASAGVLHSIILNSAATATNTTVVYDNATGAGTVIGRPAVTTATVPTTLLYDLAFANGLTIITATANGGDMTVVYS